MPFLLPPADFTPADIEKLRIVGTCEAQICRSAGPWSMGTPKLIEHSSMCSLCSIVQQAKHSSSSKRLYQSYRTVRSLCLHREPVFLHQHGMWLSEYRACSNRTLDCRKRGYREQDRRCYRQSDLASSPRRNAMDVSRQNTLSFMCLICFRACIIIPLTPGYPMPMDSPDAGAVRMIMEAQARSMYRGEHSIFARLRRVGIDPGEYINFFSLRAWGKMKTGHLCSQDVGELSSSLTRLTKRHRFTFTTRS